MPVDVFGNFTNWKTASDNQFTAYRVTKPDWKYQETTISKLYCLVWCFGRKSKLCHELWAVLQNYLVCLIRQYIYDHAC